MPVFSTLVFSLSLIKVSNHLSGEVSTPVEYAPLVNGQEAGEVKLLNYCNENVSPFISTAVQAILPLVLNKTCVDPGNQHIPNKVKKITGSILHTRGMAPFPGLNPFPSHL